IAAGRQVVVLETNRDVTERRRMEETRSRLAAVVESSDDAIVSKDLNGVITSWNRGAERIFGYTSEETVGRSIRMIIPAARQAEGDEVMRRIRRGESIAHFETVRLRKGGTELPISLTVSPMHDADGRVIGASKIARDISDLKRARQRAAFLAEASAALAGSLDYERTPQTVAALAVPSIADWCAVDVLTEAGRIARLAVAHVDPAKAELAQTIASRYEDPKSPTARRTSCGPGRR